MKTVEERLGALESRVFELTEEQIDHIASKAAEKALENVYAQVGKSVIKKFLWLIGTVVVGALIYLAGKGALPR